MAAGLHAGVDPRFGRGQKRDRQSRVGRLLSTIHASAFHGPALVEERLVILGKELAAKAGCQGHKVANQALTWDQDQQVANSEIPASWMPCTE